MRSCGNPLLGLLNYLDDVVIGLLVHYSIGGILSAALEISIVPLALSVPIRTAEFVAVGSYHYFCVSV
jgi:type III secretory pathway component EscR